MLRVILKATALWCLLVFAAIANGALRDELVAPLIGTSAALPISGLSLALLILLITAVTLPWLGRLRARTFIGIGELWVALTLAFEYLFGHFVLGKDWTEIHQLFNILAGNLFLLALLVAGLAPRLVAHWRGLVIK